MSFELEVENNRCVVYHMGDVSMYALKVDKLCRGNIKPKEKYLTLELKQKCYETGKLQASKHLKVVTSYMYSAPKQER